MNWKMQWDRWGLFTVAETGPSQSSPDTDDADTAENDPFQYPSRMKIHGIVIGNELTGETVYEWWADEQSE